MSCIKMGKFFALTWLIFVDLVKIFDHVDQKSGKVCYHSIKIYYNSKLVFINSTKLDNNELSNNYISFNPLTIRTAT